MAGLIKYSSLLRHTINCLQRTSISVTQRPDMCLAGRLRNELQIRQLSISAVKYSTFTDMSLEQLWEGCTGVSNAGKKKGRGKRGSSKRKVNIYAGKRFGYAKSKNYHYPGLNTRIMTGNTVVKMSTTEKSTDEDAHLLSIRNQSERFVRVKKYPLERGWSGAKLPGISAGPPHPYQGFEFKGFDSRVLEFKGVSHMTGHLGRKHSYSVLVVVGNGTGLVGTAVAKSSLGNAATRKAKNMASQRLQYVNLRDNRTIWHEFYSQVGQTKVFAAPKPEGYGLVCHRAIKTIAQIIGIKDMYVKVEGRTKNIQHVTDAFISGLLNMETHQDLADKTNYYVVELSDEYKVPTVLAAPRDGDINVTPLENFDLERHYMDGKTILRKPRKVKFYEKTEAYKNKDHKVWTKMRNQARLNIERQAAALE